MAIATRDAQGVIELVWRKVAPNADLETLIDESRIEYDYSLIIVGNGTASGPLVDRIRQHVPGMGVLVVNEKDTTLQAREKYWIANPRKSWRRLFPSSLQVPPEPYDDFAAFVIAERVLSGS